MPQDKHTTPEYPIFGKQYCGNWSIFLTEAKKIDESLWDIKHLGNTQPRNAQFVKAVPCDLINIFDVRQKSWRKSMGNETFWKHTTPEYPICESSTVGYDHYFWRTPKKLTKVYEKLNILEAHSPRVYVCPVQEDIGYIAIGKRLNC